MDKEVNEKQLVIFKIGKESFGVDIFEVREIIKHENITPVPEAENYVEGIINLRGSVIMLINLAKRLKISFKEETKDTRTIVVETGDTFVGMRVDEVNRVLKISSDKIQSPPKAIIEKIHDEFIEGVAVLDDELIIVLDLAKVLDNEELSSFKEKTEKEEVEEELRQEDKESKKVLEKEEVKEESKSETNKEEDLKSETMKDERKEESKSETNKEEDLKSETMKDERKEEQKHEKKSTSKPLRESEKGFHFITLKGEELKNAKELHKYVESLSEDEFKKFVTKDKNDFYNWLKFGVKDEELADSIKNLKSKNDLTKEIIKYLHDII